jgi:phage I-like protein
MSKNKTQIAACLFSLSPDADGAIQLFPAGQFDAPRGALRGQGPWKLDAPSAQRLISAVARRTNPILIDYEHQSLLVAENGKPVPAAGWIEPASLQWREGEGLFAAEVKWTGAASAHIAADEYRYLSPVFSYNADGVVLDILSVALTNNPAIDGMRAVTVAAASFFALTPPHEDPMNKALLALLGLPEDADEAAVLAAATALKAGADQVAALSTQVAALKAQTPDPAKFVPIESVKALQTELAALSATVNADKISKLIEPALADGRLLPAQKDWAESLGKSNFAALSAYLDTAQPIAALSGLQTGGKVPTAVDKTLPVEERAKAEFEGSAALRAEFGSADTYIAYCKASESGAVKILGGND